MNIDTLHIHHWKLSMPPDNGIITGTCKFCQATKEFPAVPEELSKSSIVYQKRGPQPTWSINTW